MKKNNKKGFTLAELLIVVAIIAVLTAIAIPVFSAQLEKSREATDMANLRSAYAKGVADLLDNDKLDETTIKIGSCEFTAEAIDSNTNVEVTFKSGAQSTKYTGASYSGGAFGS